MNRVTQLEHRASSRLGKHEGEPSLALCDRLDRTRDNSQRQLPTDHDYTVPTREYQTDQSSLKPAQTAARSVLVKRQQQMQRQLHRIRGVDRVTPYQGLPQFDCPDGEQASEPIIYRLFKVLFAAKISLGGEYRRVAK